MRSALKARLLGGAAACISAHWGALAPTDVRAQGATIQLPAITVIGTTPLPGAEIPREKVPAANYVLSGEELRPNEVANVTDALETRIGGVNLNQAQGNPFQPNLTYRGFEASPLAGNPQGLAVYVNGSRFNQPFGDTVNWDLIPSIAIHRMVLEGSNPAFGLNALGGSISVEMKNGFNYRGAEMELMGGSFGRINGSLQYGRQIDNVGVYAAVTGLREDGWRQFSPSRLAQFYGDIGWRGSRGEMHFNVIGASNSLTGNGTAPVELLAVDRSAVFTHPDQTRNNYARLQLSGKYELTDTWSLQGNAYYGRLSQRTKNGDATEAEPCEGDPTILCLDDDGPQLRNRTGSPIPNFNTASRYLLFPSFAERFAEGGPYAALNRTATDTHGYGATLQASNRASCSAGQIGSSWAPASTVARRDFPPRPRSAPSPSTADSNARESSSTSRTVRSRRSTSRPATPTTGSTSPTCSTSPTGCRRRSPVVSTWPRSACATRSALRSTATTRSAGSIRARVWPSRSRPRSASTAGIRKRTGRRHRPSCRARIRPRLAA